MNLFEGRRVVVGVTGGIAAYKAAELVSSLVQAGAACRVVMTRHATEFVTPITFQALSGNPVYADTFAAPETYGMGHLSLADTDALVIAPASANILGKAAAGIADDLLSTTILSVTCPVLFAPAMNAAMWRNPVVERNVATLTEVGYAFVGPERGWLACRQEDIGRMSAPATILTALRDVLWTQRDLTGRTVLVTAGPTREALDPARFLSNPSTGKQGYAIAEAAAMRGARVVLVSGPTGLPTPTGVERVDVVTAAEMADAVLSRCAEADIVIAAAAVADYAPADPAAEKQPKSPDGLTIELRPTVDIIAAVGERKAPGQVVVAFAAETGLRLDRAESKRRRKNADLIVLNDVSAEGAGFGGDENQVTILAADREPETLPRSSKLAVAHAVLERAAARLPER